MPRGVGRTRGLPNTTSVPPPISSPPRRCGTSVERTCTYWVLQQHDHCWLCVSWSLFAGRIGPAIPRGAGPCGVTSKAKMSPSPSESGPGAWPDGSGGTGMWRPGRPGQGRGAGPRLKGGNVTRSGQRMSCDQVCQDCQVVAKLGNAGNMSGTGNFNEI